MAKKNVSGHKQKKLQTMVISLLLAVVVWFMVMSLTNPTISVTLTNVNVRFIGEMTLREKHLAVTGRNDIPPASVTIKGSRADLMNYMDDVYIQVDVSNIDSEGEYEITGKITLPTTRISVENESYGGITIKAEEIISKELEVVIHQTGTASGKVVKSVPKNPAVLISGARSEIDKVNKAVAAVDITNGVSGTCFVNYLLVNESGSLISDNETIESPKSEIEIRNTAYNAKTIRVEPVLSREMDRMYSMNTDETVLSHDTVTVGLEEGKDYESVQLIIDKSPDNDEGKYNLKKEAGMYIPPEYETITARVLLEPKKISLYAEGEE